MLFRRDYMRSRVCATQEICAQTAAAIALRFSGVRDSIRERLRSLAFSVWAAGYVDTRLDFING